MLGPRREGGGEGKKKEENGGVIGNRVKRNEWTGVVGGREDKVRLERVDAGTLSVRSLKLCVCVCHCRLYGRVGVFRMESREVQSRLSRAE